VSPAHSCRDRRSLELHLLAAAPELATLALLDHALAVCATTLFAQHPTLAHDLRPEPEPPSLREARRLIAATHRSRRAITRYRNAVLDVLVPPDTDDETSPF
jgi:hypothetical protein